MITNQHYPVTVKVAQQENGFSVNAGENIGYEKGAKMVKKYFDQNEEEISAHFLGRTIIEAILSQPGAVGLTILYGINELGLPKPVVVGVNAKGDYILNVTTVGPYGQMNKQKGIVAGGGVLSTGVPQEEGW